METCQTSKSLNEPIALSVMSNTIGMGDAKAEWAGIPARKLRATTAVHAL